MTKAVYKAIAQVAGEMSKDGIGKNRTNQAQNYKFRGIDDVYNSLAPILVKAGLCILPRAISRICEERTNAKGTALFYVTVEVEFDFVAAEDGSLHTIKTYGEAMDSGDKATNKAMSAAYKYACMQAFCIPTEGDNDADAHGHDVAAKPAKKHDLGATLAALREASLLGVKALKKAANELPEGSEIDALWKDNKEALMQAAKRADATTAVKNIPDDIPA